MKSRFEKLKSLGKFFRDNVDEFLKQNAIYSEKDTHDADLGFMLKNYKIKRIGMGLLGRVYRIEGTNWVIKEGRWDVRFKLPGGFIVPLPARFFEFILKPFGFTFLPRKKEVLKQYNDYLEFAQYFGYFQSDRHYYHPNRDFMFHAQKNIRESLLAYKPQIEKKYNLKFNSKLDQVLKSSVKYHNFLPKEYLLMGKSISKENKGKITSFIFQEYIEGKILRKMPGSIMRRRHRKQLILMCYLILLMHYQTKRIPDTRPKYFLFEAYDWLTKTDNIMVTKQDLIFIDTRWMWDTSSNIIKHGLFIPTLAIKRTKYTIQKLLKDLE